MTPRRCARCRARVAHAEWLYGDVGLCFACYVASHPRDDDREPCL